MKLVYCGSRYCDFINGEFVLKPKVKEILKEMDAFLLKEKK